jgi:hypothetical protein
MRVSFAIFTQSLCAISYTARVRITSFSLEVHPMDVLFLLLTGGFFLATLGLVVLSDHLSGGSR